MSFRIWICAAAIVATASPALADHLTVARVFADPDISGPHASKVELSPDGLMATYIKSRPDNKQITDLWAVDASGGAPRRLIDATALMPADHVMSAAEKDRRERQGTQTFGVTDYDWDEEGRFVLVPVSGDLWIYERAGGKLRQLTKTPGDEIDGKVSPKGNFVSYVRDNNLYVMPSAGGAERALTTGGTDLKNWATAEFIAQEELARSSGYAWSSDEKYIALEHADMTGVAIVPRLDVGAKGAEVVEQRYPRAGAKNALVELYVAAVAGGARVKVDLGNDPDIYLARMDWSKAGDVLYVQRLSRDQKRLDLLAVDPANGKSRVILSQTSPHWVELSHDFTPLHDGDFLWSSEASGNRHIYLYDRDGKPVRQVTQGDWPVAGIEGVDEAKKLIIFSASKDNPTERRVYSVSYDHPGEPAALTPAGGWWTADVALHGGNFAGNYSDPMTPPRTGLYREDGTFIRWIEENSLVAGHPYFPYAGDLTKPSYGSIKAADGEDLWWSLHTPPNFDPAKKYPVIVQVYGGPAAQTVTRTWADPSNQLYLNAGFILFSIDNRGTPNRSAMFKDAIDHKTGIVDVQDQLAGVRYLTSLPYVDAKRIGVTGWSNGGFMTLMLLTVPDGPYAAGVAGAPPTDWSTYDTAYTERYMGTPQNDPADYAASNVVSRLGAMKPGSLMLMHGMADDNVSFVNSIGVMAALQAQAIPFEMMVYPGLRHRAGWTPKDKMHRTQTSLDFFIRKLHPTPAF
ncbi:MAG TPA: DPP IV N-terminal domain-containing protein [Rhizomicrobium sp.]